MNYSLEEVKPEEYKKGLTAGKELDLAVGISHQRSRQLHQRVGELPAWANHRLQQATFG